MPVILVHTWLAVRSEHPCAACSKGNCWKFQAPWKHPAHYCSPSPPAQTSPSYGNLQHIRATLLNSTAHLNSEHRKENKWNKRKEESIQFDFLFMFNLIMWGIIQYIKYITLSSNLPRLSSHCARQWLLLFYCQMLREQ